MVGAAKRRLDRILADVIAYTKETQAPSPT